MKRWVSIVLFIFIGLSAIVWYLPTALITRHMQSVASSLKDWGVEYSQITNDAQAFHAVEVLDYISYYYIPGGGYRGPVEVQTALEEQRRETMLLIGSALEKYSGLTNGTNQSKWYDWAERKGFKRTPGGP